MVELCDKAQNGSIKIKMLVQSIKINDGGIILIVFSVLWYSKVTKTPIEYFESNRKSWIMIVNAFLVLLTNLCKM